MPRLHRFFTHFKGSLNVDVSSSPPMAIPIVLSNDCCIQASVQGKKSESQICSFSSWLGKRTARCTAGKTLSCKIFEHVTREQKHAECMYIFFRVRHVLGVVALTFERLMRRIFLRTLMGGMSSAMRVDVDRSIISPLPGVCGVRLCKSFLFIWYATSTITATRRTKVL
jgi:hypothetical protein